MTGETRLASPCCVPRTTCVCFAEYWPKLETPTHRYHHKKCGVLVRPQLQCRRQSTPPGLEVTKSKDRRGDVQPRKWPHWKNRTTAGIALHAVTSGGLSHVRVLASVNARATAGSRTSETKGMTQPPSRGLIPRIATRSSNGRYTFR